MPKLPKPKAKGKGKQALPYLVAQELAATSSKAGLPSFRSERQLSSNRKTKKNKTQSLSSLGTHPVD